MFVNQMNVTDAFKLLFKNSHVRFWLQLKLYFKQK